MKKDYLHSIYQQFRLMERFFGRIIIIIIIIIVIGYFITEVNAIQSPLEK